MSHIIYITHHVEGGDIFIKTTKANYYSIPVDKEQLM